MTIPTIRQGAFSTIVNGASISATTEADATVFKAHGNSAELLITVETAGLGTITFGASVSPDNTTFYRKSKTWTLDASSTGTYCVTLSGLGAVVDEHVKVHYQCSSTGGDLTIQASSIEESAANSAVDGADVNATITNTEDADFVRGTIADVTNGADDTYYYYLSEDFFDDQNLQLVLDGGSGTVTVTLEGTMEPDTVQASCHYEDISSDMFGSANWTADAVLVDDTGFGGAFRYIRVKVVASTAGADDADWTIYSKKKQR